MAIRPHAVVKVLLISAFILPLVPLQHIAIRRRWSLAGKIACVVLQWALLVLRVRVDAEGTIDPRRPVLLVSNHVSWLDIPVIGALAPLSFVAKREVGQWPVFGLLARLKQSVFIDRERHATARASGAIGARLSAGDAIVLFPEGTTNDGLRVLPFRSALLGAAREALGHADGEILVQPFAVQYVRRDGLPISRTAMSAIAWVGDADLVPHLLGILNGGPIDVVVRFGEPRPFNRQTDRKALTRALETDVRRLAKGR